MEEVEGRDYKEIILAVWKTISIRSFTAESIAFGRGERDRTASFPKQSLQTRYQSYGNCRYPANSQHQLFFTKNLYFFQFSPSIASPLAARKCGKISLLPFHSNPSCNLKNSRNAGSSFKLANSLGCAAPSPAPPAPIMDRRLSAATVDEDDEELEFGVDLDDERQICARSPSSCRSPFLILMPSKEER